MGPNVIGGRFNRPEPHWYQTMPSVTHTRLAAAVLALETDCAFFTQNEGIYVWYGEQKTCQQILKSIFDLSISEAAIKLRDMRQPFVGGLL